MNILNYNRISVLNISRSCFYLAATLVGASLVVISHAYGQSFSRNGDTAKIKMRDQSVELSLKVKDSFTFAAVGDIIEMQPFTKMGDPSVQKLVNILRSADFTVANMESMIVDFDTYTGPRGANLATKEVADDLAAMGIKMVTKANNHTFDGGEQGLLENFRQLERVGIIHVGAGKNLSEARMPRYYQTGKGLAGMVGIYADSSLTSPSGGDGATYLVDGFGGKVGNNALKLQIYRGVTEDQMKQLRLMRDSINLRRVEVDNPIDLNTEEKAGSLDLFDTHFVVSDKPGELYYEMNHNDEQDIMRNIKTGKQFSDFMVATIHWHQNRYAFQHYSFDHYPADYQIKLAHEAIDNGADAFTAHGVHTIKGVEIYKGKPIFYGLSNFVFQMQIMPAPYVNPTRDPGAGEVNEVRWAWLQNKVNLEALLTTSHFENGHLTEVRIYPVDLGQNFRVGSQVGIPKSPNSEIANKILKEVQKYSEPFGTKITIEDDVGVIRIP